VRSRVFLAILLLGTVAWAAPVEPQRVYALDGLQTEGLGSTSPDAIRELLPRKLPGRLEGWEITELARRIKNLALFDLVDVEPVGRVLRVRVRRKLTVSPIFDLSSGKTLADTKVTLGAVYNDLDGHATRLGGKIQISERAFHAAIWLHQHTYRPRKWATELDAYYGGSNYRFEGADAGTSWHRNRIGGEIELLSPFVYGSPLRVELQFQAYGETLTSKVGVTPSDGFYVGTTVELIYDRYTWNDVTPQGFRMAVELRPGAFLGPQEPRHELRAKALAGVKLAQYTALLANASANLVNGGNPNHSGLVGTQQGVRGLPDSLYRTRAQAYTNVELRQGVRLDKRWFVQGVLFTDGAVFEPMDSQGVPMPAQAALSVGGGLRVLPTGLVDTIFRMDVAALVTPFTSWSVLYGITQYF
jgi:hypothetical protein